MGYAIAKKARDMGAEVILISGPVNLEPISNVILKSIESALEMKKEVDCWAKKMDYIFMVAAVADYYPKNISDKKIKRKDKVLKLDLSPCPDIIQSIAKGTNAISTAFALETHNGESEAIRKLKNKYVDFIVLNYANEKGAGFDSSTNRVSIFNKNGETFNIEKDKKERVAEKIISYILSNCKVKKILNT